MIETRPIEESTFGVTLRGVDLAASPDEETIRTIVDALHEHRLVVIEDQQLDRDQYLAFGRLLGRPHPHALDHLRMPGYPELLAVGNTEPKDREAAVRNGAAFWHTDQSYEAEPASATMLYAIKAPESGGETFIADMRGAYEALDGDMKERVDGLVALHCYGAASGDDGRSLASPIKTDAQKQRLPPVRHRLARPHPANGRKCLYAITGTAYGIEGMEEDEARALLLALCDHALDERFVHRRRHVVGDITLFDTQQTLHAGARVGFARGESDARLLWRISVKGTPPGHERHAAA